MLKASQGLMFRMIDKGHATTAKTGRFQLAARLDHRVQVVFQRDPLGFARRPVLSRLVPLGRLSRLREVRPIPRSLFYVTASIAARLNFIRCTESGE